MLLCFFSLLNKKIAPKNQNGSGPDYCGPDLDFISPAGAGAFLVAYGSRALGDKIVLGAEDDSELKTTTTTISATVSITH